MRVITIKMPEELIHLIDEYARRYGYNSRSEFIRTAVVKEMMKNTHVPDELLNGLIKWVKHNG